jgi:hypothetical protein
VLPVRPVLPVLLAQSQSLTSLSLSVWVSWQWPVAVSLQWPVAVSLQWPLAVSWQWPAPVPLQ